MPHLEFEAAASAARSEPVTFSLMGETFHCVDDPGIWPTFALAKASASQSDEDVSESLAALHDFIRAVLIDKDWPRWQRFCMSKRPNSETLMGVVQGLMPVLFGRPTEPSSSSPDSPSTNGQSSKDGSPLPVGQSTS